jgi:hypothetical protein
MKSIKTFTCILILILCFTDCQRKNKLQPEKYQDHRDNVINVKDEIKFIDTEILIGKPELYIVDSYLIINDYRPSGNKGIHLFNKNTFKYITSTGVIGKGPGEITRPGFIGINEASRELWMVDHGKRVIWKFFLDSILNNKTYKPTKKVNMNERFFIEKFDFLNDSVILGRAWDIIDNNSFKMALAKRNLNTKEIEKYGYNHPETINKGRKRTFFSFDLSLENNLFVKCYSKMDLITICDLNGDLAYNVFGPDWGKNEDSRKKYFFGVNMTRNYIIASYLGEDDWKVDKNKGPRANLPTKFLIFDIKGAYKKTIETGHEFTRFCVDEKNNRIIAYFADNKNPLGYFKVNLANSK